MSLKDDQLETMLSVLTTLKSNDFLNYVCIIVVGNVNVYMLYFMNYTNKMVLKRRSTCFLLTKKCSLSVLYTLPCTDPLSFVRRSNSFYFVSSYFRIRFNINECWSSSAQQ